MITKHIISNYLVDKSMTINKPESIEFWNEVSEEWRQRSYAYDGNTSVFPSSQIRNEVIVNILKDGFSKNSSILDIGCADGELLIDLKKIGFSNLKGIDNSDEMINVSKERFLKIFSKENVDDIFSVSDADNLNSQNKYDIVSAIGLIEYLEDIGIFFKEISSMVNSGGTILIEARNKLFNVFSANDYTKNTSDLNTLIDEINQYENRQNPSEYKEILINCIKNVSSKITLDSHRPTQKSFKNYPFDLPQHSPSELINLLEPLNFKIKDVHFYHCHLFPPNFGKNIPDLYNQIGILLQPLAKTSLGPLISSAFILELVKV